MSFGLLARPAAGHCNGAFQPKDTAGKARHSLATHTGKVTLARPATAAKPLNKISS
ncbi:hypothetical protein PSJ8397_03380 [Pseudooctadecabacter jejudonensis]|uniref:Uncharacterized protein n=1 Tax=Pseudooctadecabacter jejudonensis TaxID=1391910 RepID=A0A1Y5THJ5_9RHOB|nr:hypothetical protein PSJ8397_03380 [Pseudooctadecabacter jejudonensis]